MKTEILNWQDDGLVNIDAGPWVVKKYQTLFDYIEMFSRGMKDRWGKRVYIDLYSGPGCVRVRSTDKLLKGSPLLALSVSDKFDKYIFCEQNPENLSALQIRVSSNFPDQDVAFIEGDCNRRVLDILAKMPTHSKNQTVLSFCFVDPYSLSLDFKTIRGLADRFVDFLVLLALDMDANRNVKNYEQLANQKIDEFLGVRDWRTRWEKFRKSEDSFQRFLAKEFESQMISLGYRKAPKGNTLQVRTPDKNLPLYHLAFFSRHSKGYEFWGKALKSSPAPSLFDQ